MRWLTALWVTYSSSAALVKLPCRATASKARSDSKAGKRRVDSRTGGPGASLVAINQIVLTILWPYAREPVLARLIGSTTRTRLRHRARRSQYLAWPGEQRRRRH